jgi:hypothetical protein
MVRIDRCAIYECLAERKTQRLVERWDLMPHPR